MIYEKLEITREHPYAVVRLKIAGEPLYKFEGLSSKITEKSLNLVLPSLIERERAKRERAALRKIELAAKKERRVQRETILTEAGEEVTESENRPTEKETNGWLGLGEQPTKNPTEKGE